MLYFKPGEKSSPILWHGAMVSFSNFAFCLLYSQTTSTEITERVRNNSSDLVEVPIVRRFQLRCMDTSGSS